MSLSRRDFLLCALAAGAAQALPARAAGGRVVIVGGGWGGLAAARELRRLAPELKVTLIERNGAFWSLPLSNRWLVGRLEERELRRDYAAAAQAQGWRFVRATVVEVDRERRRVVTPHGSFDYDWLILAAGIRYDWAALLGDDARAIEQVRERHPCAFVAGEGNALKAKLDGFAGGDLIMTIPPLPYRCPPAPYERALMIGELFKRRGVRGRLVVVDPNPPMPAFHHALSVQYRDWISYVPHGRIKSFDPFRKTLVTEFDEIRYDDAIVMAPQQAADPVWLAGLIGSDAQGRPTGWADVDPLRLHARGDERVFVVGDSVGTVSPLFGAYPKTGQLASAQGRIVAADIAAQARGEAPPRRLPESVCRVFTRVEPPEALRIETTYRLRGDGLVVQAIAQRFDPAPGDEDLLWLRGALGEFFAN